MTTTPASEELERTFKLGDLVKKRGDKGQWHGKVVGFYSTDITPDGVAVESLYEKGSVQIYPASALEPWTIIASPQAESELLYQQGLAEGQLLATPQSAKDGERQAALEALNELWTFSTSPHGRSRDDTQKRFATIRAALTAKPDAGVDVEALKRDLLLEFKDQIEMDMRIVNPDRRTPTKKGMKTGVLICKVVDRVIAASGRLSSKAECPDGWKMAPIEPTEQMLFAVQGLMPLKLSEYRICYGKMIAEAPQPPIAGGE